MLDDHPRWRPDLVNSRSIGKQLRHHLSSALDQIQGKASSVLVDVDVTSLSFLLYYNIFHPASVSGALDCSNDSLVQTVLKATCGLIFSITVDMGGFLGRLDRFIKEKTNG